MSGLLDEMKHKSKRDGGAIAHSVLCVTLWNVVFPVRMHWLNADGHGYPLSEQRSSKPTNPCIVDRYVHRNPRSGRQFCSASKYVLPAGRCSPARGERNLHQVRARLYLLAFRRLLQVSAGSASQGRNR
jgi:hypothetical protein